MDNMNKGFLKGILTGLFMGVAGCALAVAILINSGSLVSLIGSGASDKEMAQIMQKVNLLEQYISAYYLKGTDDVELGEGIYKGLLESLDDPYSVYYTEEEYADLLEKTTGTYCGIGAVVMQNADTGIITIVEPYEDSPAAEAGLLPGDVIYKVEGKEVTGEDLTKVVSVMKGEEGTDVDITVLRDSTFIDVTIIRREIEIDTVDYEMLDNSIGYIEVSSFDGLTDEQFREALEDLEDQGQKGLIIDLRDNGGGRLDTVINMLDRMLPEGVVVSTKTRDGSGEVYKSTDEEQFNEPLVVLINGNSASASEVFAGAIQDYGTGKLVGTTSFGKGIVQTVFTLDDGSAVKLTTSEYFTPSGRNIHGDGLTPDVEVELDEELRTKLTIEKSEDNQLQAAIKEIEKEIE